MVLRNKTIITKKNGSIFVPNKIIRAEYPANNKSGEVDNTNYINEEKRILFNRNLDNTKLAFDAATALISIQKVGDLFNQEGIDIINSMLPILVNNQNRYWDVYFFIKDAPTGNVAEPMVSLMYNGVDNLFTMKFGSYSARVSDKFTLDTPMSRGGIA